MSSVRSKILYFDRPGPDATGELLQYARRYADERGIKDVVVSSTTGKTGAEASRLFKGLNTVVVTHHFGFTTPNRGEMAEEYRSQILGNGAKVYAGTHALSGPERAIRKKFNTLTPLELIANVYRTFGQGMKVCVEIALMASDAGLIPTDRDVLSIAGTGKGADTAIVLRPAISANFFELKIRELVAKPKDF